MLAVAPGSASAAGAAVPDAGSRPRSRASTPGQQRMRGLRLIGVLFRLSQWVLFGRLV
jgi:hypothetical protein